MPPSETPTPSESVRTQAPPNGAGRPTPHAHLLDRLAVLHRHRHLAMAIFALTALAVVVRDYTALQFYRATARVLIEDERSTAIPGLAATEAAFYQDPEPYYQTQYKILKGRDLARQVARELKLDQVAEFNGAGRAPSAAAPLAQSASVAVDAAHPATTSAAPRPGTAAALLADDEWASYVDGFLGRVSVDPVRGSRLVDISFTSVNPQFAAAAVNALVQSYVRQNLAVKQETTGSTLEWLAKELTDQQDKVEASERALAEYRDHQNALSLDDKQNIVVARLNQLNDAATRAKTARIQKEALYSQLQALPAGSTADTLLVIAQNPQIQGLKVKLAELQRERVRLAERYGEKHPQIQNANAAFQDATRQLELETQKALQGVRRDYESAVLEEQTLVRSLEAAKGDATDLNRKSISYNVLEREAKSNRQVYESLLQREKELRVASNSQANNVRIVDRAEIPRAPMKPGGRRTWLIAIAIGLALSLAVVFALDYLNDTVKTPEDVTTHFNVPFLGLVPAVSGSARPLLSSSGVSHEFGESFRALRTALISHHGGAGTKIIVVTSGQPLEGKTTTAVNIATALAYSGARVLVIDADMRRPGLHQLLQLKNERGLSDILVGRVRIRDVVQQTPEANLVAITAGEAPHNPSELLASQRMKALLGSLEEVFDWVIIDTPPVLAVTDAVILAPHATGVTLVIGAEMTRRRLVERAIDTITQGQPRTMTVVLNKVDFVRNRYYYSRYYGHQYRSYYAQV